MDEQEETQVKTNNNNVVDMEVDNETTEDDVLMVDIKAKKYNAVDIVKLLDLLKASKKAGDLIAEKHVMLLIGLTGAGKVSRVQYHEIRVGLYKRSESLQTQNIIKKLTVAFYVSSFCSLIDDQYFVSSWCKICRGRRWWICALQTNRVTK